MNTVISNEKSEKSTCSDWNYSKNDTELNYDIFHEEKYEEENSSEESYQENSLDADSYEEDSDNEVID